MEQLRQLQTSRHFAVAIVFLGAFADITVYSVIIPIIPFILQDINEPTTDIGILLALYGLGVIGGSLSFGLLVSRNLISKKWGMVGSLGVVWLSILLFALSRSLWLLALARFCQGFASCGVFVLGLSFIADLYDGDDKNLGMVMGVIFSGLAVGQVVGPPVGGALYEVGKHWPFVFCAVLVFLDLVGRLLIVERKGIGRGVGKEEVEGVEMRGLGVLREDSAQTVIAASSEVVVMESTAASSAAAVGEPAKEAKIGLIRSLRNSKDLAVVCSLCFVLSLCLTQLEPTLPLHLTDLYGYNSAQIGFTFLAFVLPNVLGGILGGHLFDLYGTRTVCLFSIPSTVLSMALLAIPGPEHIAWTCVTLMVAGFAVGVAFAPVAPGVAAALPKELYTWGYVVMNLVFSFGIAVGPMVGGYLYEGIGWGGQMAVFTGLLAVYYPVVWWMPRKVEEMVGKEGEVGGGVGEGELVVA
ncbi:hypothetical protein HDU98_006874 [Podochytrium sp. JEL0797]|nr:hypothetical protein HDU98_006874 [Podochytrium sp. JEL0797]